MPWCVKPYARSYHLQRPKYCVPQEPQEPPVWRGGALWLPYRTGSTARAPEGERTEAPQHDIVLKARRVCLEL